MCRGSPIVYRVLCLGGGGRGWRSFLGRLGLLIFGGLSFWRGVLRRGWLFLEISFWRSVFEDGVLGWGLEGGI